MTQKPEILAPAGGPESLTAALRAGADAVYVGGKQFSARSSAANFSNDELREAVRQCRRYGAKIYLAVNTVISDSEAGDFCEYIKLTSGMGIDGYIVQDWGAAHIIRAAVPDAVIHASTQMSVHTAAGARLLSGLGFARVVPARELDKAALEKICQENIETEVFVHGALCMSVSGQCYMSAMIGSRSANRGCCGQACRLPFSAAGDKNRAALSLKDLSLLERAGELADIGVDSLKIEGRMKRPEYTASAVSELKKALDGEAPDMQTLKGVFSRGGFTDGYFTGKRQNMFGVREKEDVIAARSILPQLHELYRSERQVHTIDIHADVKLGQPVRIKAVCGDISAEVTGGIPDSAQNRPLDISGLEKQLAKLGDTVFRLGELTADIDGGLFIPAGKLNELRRTLTVRLEELIIEKNTPVYHISDYSPSPPPRASERNGKLPLRTVCRSAEQAKAALELSEYVIPEGFSLSELMLREAGLTENADRVILSPPRFIADEERLYAGLERMKSLGFERLLCHTPDHIAVGKELGFRLHGGFGLNIFNSYSIQYMKSLGMEDIVFSFEAKLRQLDLVHADIPVGAVVCGRLPLMLTRNCPIKNEVGCESCTGQLTDRTGRAFPVACSPYYTEILNSDTLFMLDRLDEFRNADFGMVLLSKENADQTRSLLMGIKSPESVTRGLYYRGIE